MKSLITDGVICRGRDMVGSNPKGTRPREGADRVLRNVAFGCCLVREYNSEKGKQGFCHFVPN